MTGPLKAAWGLVLFVIVVGIVGWATSGRAVFAVFIVLGVLTGGAALAVFRNTPSGPSSPGERT